MMLKPLGDLAVLLCGIYFISLGLSHVRPQAFANVGSIVTAVPTRNWLAAARSSSM